MWTKHPYLINLVVVIIPSYYPNNCSNNPCPQFYTRFSRTLLLGIYVWQCACTSNIDVLFATKILQDSCSRSTSTLYFTVLLSPPYLLYANAICNNSRINTDNICHAWVAFAFSFSYAVAHRVLSTMNAPWRGVGVKHPEDSNSEETIFPPVIVLRSLWTAPPIMAMHQANDFLISSSGPILYTSRCLCWVIT